MPELETRLEEIDRKLREIQGELVPGEEAPPGPSGSTPRRGRAGQAAAGDPLTQHLERLNALHASLLSSLTEVLGRFHEALAEAQGSSGRELTVSAGPFASIEEMRSFEQELARLPGVREVTVRGYEGDDRALIDVQLSAPTT